MRCHKRSSIRWEEQSIRPEKSQHGVLSVLLYFDTMASTSMHLHCFCLDKNRLQLQLSTLQLLLHRTPWSKSKLAEIIIWRSDCTTLCFFFTIIRQYCTKYFQLYRLAKIHFIRSVYQSLAGDIPDTRLA